MTIYFQSANWLYTGASAAAAATAGLPPRDSGRSSSRGGRGTLRPAADASCNQK